MCTHRLTRRPQLSYGARSSLSCNASHNHRYVRFSIGMADVALIFFFFRCSQIILTWTEAWGTVSQAVRQAGTTHIFTFVSFVCRCQGCLLRLDVHLLWPAHEQKQNPCHCIYDSLFSLHSLANPATNDNEKSEEKKISCGAGNSVARHIYIYADIRYGLEYFRIKLYLVYLCVRCVCCMCVCVGIPIWL